MDPGYPDGEWRTELRLQADLIRKARARERQIVAQALAAGATWSAIAGALGCSRQTAHRKYRRLAPVVRESVGS